MKPRYYVMQIAILSLTVIILMISAINKNQNTLRLTESMEHYNAIISKQIKTIAMLEEKLNRTQLVKISFYHPASRGINSDSDHTNTATMTRPIAGYTIAISDELFYDGWLGCKVYINGFGVFHAKDRMDKSVTGKQIDICAPSKKIADRLGVKYDVIAVKL
ncbi:MAG: hypothetical protein JRE47_10170 [Deltaproteobacteria bacterium]|nr:hypothetical protein [Deltaproteobacteria bacterium]